MQPYVILNSAMSLDGRIGTDKKQIVFSNRLDNYRVRTLRNSVDAVMVGIETVLTDNPEIVLKEVADKKPVKVIVDKNAETPHDAKILKGDTATIIAVSNEAPKGRAERLGKISDNVEIMTIGGAAVNLKELLWKLYGRGIRKVLLEGGRALNRRMLDEGLVSEIYLTIAPILLGEGISFFESKTPEHVELKLEGIMQYGNQVVLHYLVK